MREQQQHDEVLWQVEWLELGPVAGAELRAVDEEERHVGAEARRDRVELGRLERSLQLRVREPQGGRCIGAAAAEPGRNRNVLLDRDPPAVRRRESARAQRVRACPRRSRRPSCPAAGSTVMRSPRSTRWYTVSTSCFPSARSGPTTSARLIFAGAGAITRAPPRVPGTPRGSSSSARTFAARPIAASASAARSREASTGQQRASWRASCDGGRRPPRRAA